MKIIIDIPEEMIEAAKTDLWCSSPTLGYAIKKSIPYKERPHGEIYKDMKGQFCSVCDKQSVWKFDFCPNCGASMVKEGEAK